MEKKLYWEVLTICQGGICMGKGKGGICMGKRKGGICMGMGKGGICMGKIVLNFRHQVK